MGQAPDWMAKGKTIAGLIQELRTFDDQELEVRISTDDGVTTHLISLVGRQDGLLPAAMPGAAQAPLVAWLALSARSQGSACSHRESSSHDHARRHAMDRCRIAG
jgi:hypothetical protein